MVAGTGSWDEASLVSSGANTRILSVAGHLEEDQGHLPQRPLSAKYSSLSGKGQGLGLSQFQGGGVGVGVGLGVGTGTVMKHSSKGPPLPPPPPPLTGSAALYALLAKKPPASMAHLMTQKETKKWVYVEEEAARLLALEEEHTVQVTPLTIEGVYMNPILAQINLPYLKLFKSNHNLILS